MKNAISVEDLWKSIEESNDEGKEFVLVSKMISDLISEMVIVRNKKNLTQRQLAEITGIKQSAIARMEKLQAIPRIDTLAKIFFHLGISLSVGENVKEVCKHYLYIAEITKEHSKYNFDEKFNTATSFYESEFDVEKESLAS